MRPVGESKDVLDITVKFRRARPAKFAAKAANAYCFISQKGYFD